MIDIGPFMDAVHMLSGSWEPWLIVFPGLLIGLLFHAIPGLTTSIAIALFLPVLPYMSFLQSLVFMTAMYTGSLFGVAIPAILLNIPGSAAAVATTFDGFPMAQQGRQAEALGYALAASVVGQGVAYIILLFLVQPIGELAIKLGPAEMCIVALWGLSMIAGLRGRYVSRGLMAGLLGLLLGTIGFSDRGTIRGTMGIEALLDGIPTIPAVVGMFAAAELFGLVKSDYIATDPNAGKVSLMRIVRAAIDTLRYPVVLLRGSLLGAVIGTLPGGHAVANLLSYSEARRTAKDPEAFGTGDPRGVIAAEAGNASSEGGSIATLLALGIPTGGATAIMLVAFDMHNITGGPQFMHDHKDLVYAVILSNLAQILFLIPVGLAFTFAASYVIRIPLRVIIPTVLSLAVIGAYALNGNMAGPATLAVFAVLGWLLQRFEYPVSAAVVGLLLAKLTEGAMMRTYQMSGGDPHIFIERPAAGVLLLLLLASLLWPAVKSLRRRGAPPAPVPGH